MSANATALSQAANPSANKREAYADCAAVILCAPALTAFLFGIALLLLTGNSPGHHDFVSYWTAGHQLLNHSNPYDGAAILNAELGAGFPHDAQVLVMRNPPWALGLVLPLGLLGVRIGSAVWTLALIGCLIASVRMTAELLGDAKSRLHLFGYAFAPALLCVLAGQSSLFALLGLVLFLRWHRTRPLAAGAATYLCTLKPHLFLPFAAALLLWIAATRSYRLLAGFVATLATASLLATWFDPAVWTHYRQMMQSSGIATEFIACPAVALRFAIHQQAVWLQYVPVALGCAWAVFYFARHRAKWDWLEHGGVLVLVSLTVSPYAWVTDQAIALPALTLATQRWASPGQIRLLLLASAAIEIEQLCGVTMHSPLVVWTSLFWLVWHHSVAAGKRRGGFAADIAVPQPAG
jgi:hypothetical protein